MTAADIASFNRLLTTPQWASDAAKIQGATARLMLSGLKDALRSGMELIRDVRPMVYEALHEASQVDEVGSDLGENREDTGCWQAQKYWGGICSQTGIAAYR